LKWAYRHRINALPRKYELISFFSAAAWQQCFDMLRKPASNPLDIALHELSINALFKQSKKAQKSQTVQRRSSS